MKDVMEVCRRVDHLVTINATYKNEQRRIRRAIRALDKRIFRIKTKLWFKRWSVENWLKGYKFGPVQRHRCCAHTTPHHYQWCDFGGAA